MVTRSNTYVSQMIFIKNIFTFLHVTRNKIQSSFFFCQINNFKHIMAFLKKQASIKVLHIYDMFLRNNLCNSMTLLKNHMKSSADWLGNPYSFVKCNSKFFSMHKKHFFHSASNKKYSAFAFFLTWFLF